MNHGDAKARTHRAWYRGERMAMTGMVLFGVPSVTLFLLVFGWLALAMFDPSFLPDSAADQGNSEPFSPAVLFGFMGVTLLEHIGLVMILWALFVTKLRARWFYYAMQIATVLMLVSAGGIVLAWAISRYLHGIKSEFWVSPPVAAPSNGRAGLDTVAPPALPSSIPYAAQQDVLVAENERLKRIVAAQALEIHRLKEGV